MKAPDIRTALPGPKMRPHVMAHKCTALARRQLEAGHTGFTCATIRHWEQEDLLYCWGHNTHGQLGNREVQSFAMPVPAFGTIRYGSLAAGSRHVCGVSRAGTVFCWGANERGQLGNGSVTQSNVPFPIRVSRRVTFTSVTVGEAHSCALTAEGEAYCWGSNDQGELGNGTNASRAEPKSICSPTRPSSVMRGKRRCGSNCTKNVP